MSEPVPYVFTRNLKTLPSADVLVAGGGMAGFSAACAAAKQGAKVLLLEQFADLGGVATTAGTAAFCGETTGQGEVFDSVIRELERLDAIAAYKPYIDCEARSFDHEVLKMVLQEAALAAGVDILFHTRLVDADASNGRIETAVLHNKSGLQAVHARTVIDATGEADLAHRAGFATVKGRDGDGAQLPMALNFFLREAARVVQQELPAAPAAPGGKLEAFANADELPMVSVWPQDDGKVGIKLKVTGRDATDGRSLSEAEIDARRMMWRVVHFLQRHKLRKFELSRHRFDYLSPIIGIREGRRVLGEYVLNVDDLRAGRQFDDAVALGVFYLDCMDPATPKKAYLIDWEQRHVPPYHVPFRALRPKGSRNLLVAGRCFSADQLALSSARVMTTASMMGQAAGIAAAWCARDGSELEAVYARKLRAELETRGARLEPKPGMTPVN
ncbi:MAG: FAD-dependent oxidoreductase [Planctomycetes bacterium]|nr:FAD-dependent oxidoreductase [Planctomycetota bacterium]